MSIFNLTEHAMFILFSMICFFPVAAVQAQKRTSQSPEDSIINKERGALDRWKAGDTFGFIEIAADDITYFDPAIKQRVTGLKQFREYLSSFNGTFSFPRYELVNPQVQLYGDIGVLTFNFIGYSKDDKQDKWNTTEVYRRIKGEWKLVSSHWSHTKV